MHFARSFTDAPATARRYDDQNVQSTASMRIAPLPGPHGLYTVSVMPRFLCDSRRVGWQGAYFADIDGAAEGQVDHAHTRYCIHRCNHRQNRRAHGSRRWDELTAGFSVYRAGDEQRFDWRVGGRSQFLFVAPELAQALFGHARPLPPAGQQLPLRAPLLDALFDALQADLAQGSPAGPLRGETLIAAVLAQLGAAGHAPTARLASRGHARVVELIEARYAQPLSLQELADAAGTGQRQFCRAFREATGLSPHQYLLRHRVVQAQRLIAGGMPLAEVALQCGFNDQSQLTRTFVRQVGTTPGRYRDSLGR